MNEMDARVTELAHIIRETYRMAGFHLRDKIDGLTAADSEAIEKALANTADAVLHDAAPSIVTAIGAGRGDAFVAEAMRMLCGGMAATTVIATVRPLLTRGNLRVRKVEPKR